MSFTAGNIFIRLRKQFNVNHFQFIINARPTQPCNIINIQKRYKTKLSKPNLYVPNRNEGFSTKKEKIGVYGYCLLSVPIVTFLLGTWQVQRRKWKLNLLETLSKRINHKPIELPNNLEELESKEYYPIKVKGTFVYEKEFVIGPRSLIVDGDANSSGSFFGSGETQKGYCVITPFKLLDQDCTILINRGWIPRTHKSPVKRQEGQIEGEVEITGILRLNEKRPPFVPKHTTKDDMWYYRDVNEMAKKAGTAPIYLEMISNKDFPKFPIGSQTKVNIRNEHLSYIITWYSLSAATGYMWYKLVVKKVPGLV
ncbi:surfeit locus protein 1 isoform X1 [Colletes gigas]|uniref:surfeit locus protein 1 isoform X1 n=1 Tax=Colletes gigas TaxID=935657 RepID=UPI001C9B26FF|nr:surfeit locus protein 1 isoform X1 [Colletes gigas]